MALTAPLDDELDLEGHELLDDGLGGLGQHREPVLVDDKQAGVEDEGLDRLPQPPVDRLYF